MGLWVCSSNITLHSVLTPRLPEIKALEGKAIIRFFCPVYKDAHNGGFFKNCIGCRGTPEKLPWFSFAVYNPPAQDFPFHIGHQESENCRELLTSFFVLFLNFILY